jgi:uncharacterized protein YkwD
MLLFLATSTSALAQHSYAPHTPRYSLNGGSFASPVQGQSPPSMPQVMLEAHNAIRASVGVPPLVWSDQLAEVAQDWANYLIATGGLSHRPNNRYGENVYTITGGTATPYEGVDLWAKEARGYDSRQQVLGGLRPLHAACVEQNTRCRLRRRRCSSPGDLGVQL